MRYAPTSSGAAASKLPVTNFEGKHGRKVGNVLSQKTRSDPALVQHDIQAGGLRTRPMAHDLHHSEHITIRPLSFASLAGDSLSTSLAQTKTLEHHVLRLSRLGAAPRHQRPPPVSSRVYQLQHLTWGAEASSGGREAVQTARKHEAARYPTPVMFDVLHASMDDNDEAFWRALHTQSTRFHSRVARGGTHAKTCREHFCSDHPSTNAPRSSRTCPRFVQLSWNRSSCPKNRESVPLSTDPPFPPPPSPPRERRLSRLWLGSQDSSRYTLNFRQVDVK